MINTHRDKSNFTSTFLYEEKENSKKYRDNMESLNDSEISSFQHISNLSNADAHEEKIEIHQLEENSKITNDDGISILQNKSQMIKTDEFEDTKSRKRERKKKKHREKIKSVNDQETKVFLDDSTRTDTIDKMAKIKKKKKKRIEKINDDELTVFEEHMINTHKDKSHFTPTFVNEEKENSKKYRDNMESLNDSEISNFQQISNLSNADAHEEKIETHQHEENTKITNDDEISILQNKSQMIKTDEFEDTESRKRERKKKKHREKIKSVNDQETKVFLDDSTRSDTIDKMAKMKKKKKKHMEKINDDEMTVFEENIQDNETTSFQIKTDVWLRIKPKEIIYEGKCKRKVRRLQGDWTRIFAKGILETHPGCVLAFRSHRVKQNKTRKSSGPFIVAKAVCKGSTCCRSFTFTIHQEPLCDTDVLVNIKAEGFVIHDESEVNRRNIAGDERHLTAQELSSTTVASYFSKNLLNADKNMLKQGNFSDTPNKAVLRKIVSEILEEEQLHQNILAELDVLKESQGKQHYIQDIGMDPFTLILFSEDQIKLVKQLSKTDELNLFIDATGSIIHTIKGQKKPYLYSIVIKPNKSLPPVSIADMLTTQHTIPRIELFFGTFIRATLSGRRKLNIRKIETDYSYALIQAVLKSFNTTTLKRYILQCFDHLNLDPTNESIHSIPFTVIHLCSAHMIKDFIRCLKQYKVEKTTKHLMVRLFAILQNTTSMECAKEIYRFICITFLSEKESLQTTESLRELKRHLKNIDPDHDLNEESEENEDETQLPNENELQEMTIKEASPFTAEFTKVKNRARKEINQIEGERPNALFFPAFIECLERFFPIFPLWSGIMLRFLIGQDNKYLTRDTNTAAEIWFKYLKCDLKLKRLRPAKFVNKLKDAVVSRLIQYEFQGADKRKSKTLTEQNCPEANKGKNTRTKIQNETIDSQNSLKVKTTAKKRTKKEKTLTTDAFLEIKEEIWKENKTKKKPKYHNIQRTMENLPKVMGWGGKVEDIYITNTCTIDNGLTIINLFHKDNQQFRYALENELSKVGNTLKSVMMLMSKSEFAAAKAIWADLTETKEDLMSLRKSLFGDEYDFMFKHLDEEWLTTVKSVCDNNNCTNTISDGRPEHGCICLGYPTGIENIQNIIDWWMNNNSPCVQVDVENYEHTSEASCTGLRTHKREIMKTFPVLPVRIYELFLNGKLSVKTLMQCTTIELMGCIYKLAGITMHKEEHYCSIVCYKDSFFLYDGLRAKLGPIVKDLEKWFPSYLVFCYNGACSD